MLPRLEETAEGTVESGTGTAAACIRAPASSWGCIGGKSPPCEASAATTPGVPGAMEGKKAGVLGLTTD